MKHINKFKLNEDLENEYVKHSINLTFELRQVCKKFQHLLTPEHIYKTLISVSEIYSDDDHLETNETYR